MAGRKLVRWIAGGSSFLSASDHRLIVGLGPNAKVDKATVVWPSGQKQEFRDLAGDRGWRLRENQQPEPSTPGKSR